VKLLEFEHIDEAFTPQIEGWYDRNDIRIWFQKNYSSQVVRAWDEATSGLVTEMDIIQKNPAMMSRYKQTDIELMNEWLDGYFPFKMIDLDYSKGQAIWKVESNRAMDRE
jgi:hypothetical protein